MKQRENASEKMQEIARERERIRKNLLYYARVNGWEIDTRNKVIFADNPWDWKESKTLVRLVKEFGFSVRKRIF